MEYVGFFEDMLWDFPRLSDQLFSHATGNFIYRTIYTLGNIIGLVMDILLSTREISHVDVC